MYKVVVLIFLTCNMWVMHQPSLMAQGDAVNILKKVDDNIYAIKDKTVALRMEMTNTSSGKTKEKEAVLMQKGMDRKLFRYTAPESDVGIATLSLPNSEIYVYLPMFKKPKKITNLADSGIFNNSDFSIEDMATQSYSEKYTPEFVREEGDLYVLNLMPNEEKPSYPRVVVYINKKHYYPVQFDFHDKKDELVKQSQYQHVKVNGLWVAEMVSMEDFKKKHKTTLYMSDIALNQGLSDDLFLLENLAPEQQ